jgi:peptidoglycan/LPS O-acetylase OafA/YrhL
VVLPGLLLGAVGVALWRRGAGRLAAACLLANVVPFVLLLNVYRDGYTASGRATTGVVLAALMCVPYLRALPRTTSRLLPAAVAVWATMLPVVAVYGLTDARV